jgi:hypothetical protein
MLKPLLSVNSRRSNIPVQLKVLHFIKIKKYVCRFIRITSVLCVDALVKCTLMECLLNKNVNQDHTLKV